MPSWDKVLTEITQESLSQTHPVDAVRRRYLKQLADFTKRNVIAYYSGWLSSPVDTPNIEIGDDDINGFMTAVHGMDRSKGLDLIIHSPGGHIAATEAIVNYLWTMFDKDVRAIVPQIAMSAGTMIACSCKSILMGKQSSLGPVDPQLGGVAAQAVLDEFDMAVESIDKDPRTLPLWQSIIGKYHPTFILECIQAIQWSRDMVATWLKDNMLDGSAEPEKSSLSIVSHLSDHTATRSHSRHLSMDKCKTIGLFIDQLEDNNELQDLVLTTHHAFMHTFSQTSSIKIIENHMGIASVLHAKT